MRGAQLARQWKILRLLESRKPGISVAEISTDLDIPSRTIYRDLEAIQEAGFPVYTEKKDRNSYWKLIEGFRTGFPLPLSATELMSLHISRDILKIFEGTPFQGSIESLVSKVRAALPPETIGYLDNISARIRVGFGATKDYSTFREVISELSQATAKNRQVEILYTALSTGQENRRRVDPYQVWATNGAFYLIGRCHLRNAVRTFVVDRIKEFKVLDDSFHYPEDFSLEDYLQAAFRVMRGTPEVVRVWFRAKTAQVVKERIWHPTQEIRDQEDGSLVVTLEVPINYEVISWILSFGAAARVLQPESLRARICRELDVSLQAYRSEDEQMKKSRTRKKIETRVS